MISLPEILVYLVRKIGLTTLFAFGLLVIALGSTAWAFAEVVQDLAFDHLLLVTVYGLLTGWLLARSRLSGRMSAAAAVILGVLSLYARSARLGVFGWTLLVRVLGAGQAIARWIWVENAPFPDLQPVELALAEFAAAASALASRLTSWMTALLRGEQSYDPLITVLLWGLLVWFLSVWAAWQHRRHGRPLAGIAPAGLLMASLLNYVRSTPGPLLVLLGSTLGLMVLTNQQKREDRWNERALDYPNEIRMDLGLIAVPLVIFIMVVAFLVPSVSIRSLVEAAQRLAQNQPESFAQVGESLGVKQGIKPRSYYDDIRYAGLPREHLIGSGPELSEIVVMTVAVKQDALITGNPYLEGQRPSDEAGLDPAERRYYWRSLTYDHYNGLGWSSRPVKTVAYPARQPVFNTLLPGLRLIEQEVVGAEESSGLVHATGQLVTTDQDFEAAWRSLPEDGSYLSADLFGATTTENIYEARSLLPSVSEAQLLSAGSSYPEWILARYLGLPETLPNRVRDLALNLTAGQPTPYERAVAIEGYLRQFPYTLDLPAPPGDRDVVDYFLFDLQRGYCDYYSTAMVVLARAAGLPAREVVGYATGAYDPETSRYVVTEADAHSWPEIFFPGVGWIEFEPTSGRPAIERPSESQEPVFPENFPQEPSPEENQSRGFRTWILAAVAGAILLAGLVWLLVEAWRLNRLAPADAAGKIYAGLRRSGEQLVPETPPGDTPNEFSARLKRTIQRIQARILGQAIRPAAHEADALVQLYNRAAYSRRPPTPGERQRAITTWLRLRIRLWLARLFR